MNDRVSRRITFSAGFLTGLLMCAGLTGAWCADRGSAEEDSAWARYKIVGERNIFDSSRGPRSDSTPKPYVAPKPPPKTLDLTGVIVRAEGSIAFFEGSAVSGSEMAGEGDVIAGLRVERITTDGVALLDGETTATLKVGFGMSKPSDGNWSMADKLAGPSGASGGGEESPEQDASGLSLLEKLKQRRAKENKQ
jgi:hypothetical protein